MSKENYELLNELEAFIAEDDHDHLHEHEHSHDHEHSHEHDHHHSHSHDHTHSHEHGDGHSHDEIHSHSHDDGSAHTHVLDDGTVITHVHHGHIHSPEHTKSVVNRLARAIGHLESVKKMVESGRDCPEVLIQLAAVKSAINNTGKVILQEHIKTCVFEAIEHGDDDTLNELYAAIDKFMK